MNPNQNYWNQRAVGVAFLVNLGWWFQSVSPYFIGTNSVFALVFLGCRQQAWETSFLWWGYSAVILAIMIIGGIAGRRRFFKKADGLVRIESYLGLNNALTAAREGHVSWPEPAPIPSFTFNVHLRSLLTPIIVSLLILLAGLWIPISDAQRDNLFATPEEPVVWGAIEAWTTELEEAGITDEEALDDLKQKLTQLREQPEALWYSHASLEAGESLKEHMQQSLQSLEENLQQSAALATVLKDLENIEQRDALQSMFSENLAHLEMGTLPLNREMLAQMKQLQAADGQSPLSKEQMQTLIERMKKGMKACQNCLGSEGFGGMEWAEMIKQYGTGGIERGRGDAPLFYNRDARFVEPTHLKSVSNQNYDNAMLGDALSVSIVEEELDTVDFEGLRQGEAARHLGTGGDAVWKQNLLPEERKILQAFYQ